GGTSPQRAVVGRAGAGHHRFGRRARAGPGLARAGTPEPRNESRGESRGAACAWRRRGRVRLGRRLIVEAPGSRGRAVRVVSFAPQPRSAATARWIAVAAFLVYVVSGGGRIVGSDEVTMLELSRAMLRGGIAVPEGATLAGRDGRQYTKNAAAQAVLATPLVVAAEITAGAAHLSPPRQALAVRFVVSFFNAIVTAILLAAFYLIARRLRVGPRAALGATLMLGFTTPVWVYSKSFMAEPLQSLGLLLALAGCAGTGEAP